MQSLAKRCPSPPQSECGGLPIIFLCLAVFSCYLTVGMPLPVIPLFVSRVLGYPDWIVGLAVGIQFFATVSTRKFAGGIADNQGGDVALRRGLVACSLAGFTYLAAAWLPTGPAGKLAVLMLGRLLLGVGESLLLTGGLAWAIGLAGPARSGRVMSWVGMAMYGALAAGAPAGLALDAAHGFLAVAVVVTILPLLAFAALIGVPKSPPNKTGIPVSFRRVVGIIWRPGLALGLQGVGFAGIGAFVSLYFVAEGWSGTGLTLSAFGGAFICARILCGELPDKFGGARVALAFFVIEIAGQAVLATASHMGLAMTGAALTGFGCSMIFPALGVETVKRTQPESRGTALGAFAAFQDIAYALTGPVTGTVAGLYGYRSVFLIGTAAALCGLAITVPMLRQK